MSVNNKTDGGRDFQRVLWEFSQAGYDAEWTTLRASDFGLPHRRERVFVVAHTERSHNTRRADVTGTAQGGQSHGQPRRPGVILGVSTSRPKRGKQGGGMDSGPQADHQWETNHNKPDGSSAIVSDAGRQRSQGEREDRPAAGATRRSGGTEIPTNPPGPGDRAAWADILDRWPEIAPAIESSFCGMVDGFPVWLDRTHTARCLETSHGPILPIGVDRRKRLKALGNAVVPACARWVAERIVEADSELSETFN